MARRSPHGIARPHAWVAVALSLGLLFLAGCGGDDEPEPKFSESSDASTSSAGDPTSGATDDPSGGGSEPAEPEMPAKAKKKSYAGAEAFAKYYFRVFSYALKAGDTDQLESLGAPRCATCRGFVDQVRKVYDAGGHYESKGWSVEAVAKIPGYSPSKPALGLRVEAFPYREFNEKDTLVETSKRGTFPMRAILERRNAEWRIVRLDIIE